MGQKVNPIGFRVGVNKEWNATWYADKQTFADNLVEDQKIRKFLKKNYSNLITMDIICHGVASPKYFEKYKEYLEQTQSIYSMIFKDLDCLFYQLV